MNRRHFISSSAMLCTPVFLPNLLPAHFDKKFKFGLQLFTLNREMKNDPIGTLKIVKSFGFEDCEIYGYNGENRSFYGIPAKDFNKTMQDIGLTVSSGHFSFNSYFEESDENMVRYVDQCCEGAKTMGMDYITWPYLNPVHRSLTNFHLLGEKLNKIAIQVQKAGLKFAYHNHDFEFKDYNGITGYEIILKETDPNLVKLQMDLYWVMHSSKLTPKQLIDANPGRFVMWHIKDMDKVTRDYTELGNGSIDYTTIMPNPHTSGLQFYYLEQGGNFKHSGIKSVEESAQYFNNNLRKFF